MASTSNEAPSWAAPDANQFDGCSNRSTEKFSDSFMVIASLSFIRDPE
jgi:hypothetical protein